MSHIRKIAVNSLSNIFYRIGGNLISIITLPLFLSIYGDVQYGIYLLIIGITQMTSVMDFGVNRALVRYIAEFQADKDTSKLQNAINAGILVTVAMSIVSSVLLILLAFKPNILFNIPVEYLEVAQHLFLLSAAYVILHWISLFLQGFMEGYQLFNISNRNNSLLFVTMILLYFIVKYYPIDFEIFVSIVFSSKLVSVLLDYLSLRKRKAFDGLEFNLRVNRSVFFNEFTRYSLNLFVISIVSVFSMQSDKLILGVILPISFVTIYTVVTKPFLLLKMIANTFMLVVDPIIAKESRAGNIELINKFIKKGILVHSLMVIPAISITMLLLPPFITLWIGTKYSTYIIWGQVSCICLVFSSIIGVYQKVLTITGNVKKIRDMVFVTVFINVVVSVVLTYYIGIGGVVIGTLVEVMVRVPYLYALSLRYTAVSVLKTISFDFIMNILYVAATALIIHYYLIADEYTWITFIQHAFIIAVIAYGYSFYALVFKKVIDLKQLFTRNN